MNKRRLGDFKEIRAVEFLKAKDYDIVARNFRCKYGEIDIVAMNEGYLVFVEVKYRSSLEYGSPGDAIGYGKQKNIYKVAEIYMIKNKLPIDTPVRFDTVLILGDEPSLIKNAFGAL